MSRIFLNKLGTKVSGSSSTLMMLDSIAEKKKKKESSHKFTRVHLL